MATFTSQIFEILTLNGDNVGSSVTQTINDINFVDNRILSVPTGSVTSLFLMGFSSISFPSIVRWAISIGIYTLFRD